MNAQHTAGRLAVIHDTDIIGTENDPENGCVGTVDVAHVYLRTVPGRTEANARRLVACWNAFEGVPTEKFEGKSITEYVTNEAYITGVTDGRMGMAGESAQVFIHALAGVFVGIGAENYLEMSFTHPGTGPFHITMQKTTGKTPHECRKDAEAQRDELLTAMNGLLAYFESGNGVPVSQATIKANSAEVLAARAATAKAGGEA